MNWDAIGAVGEILGAIAVFGSLAYLALQIKANTASMKTASRQSMSNEFRSFNRLLFEAPEEFASGLHSYPEIPFQVRSKFCGQIHDLLLFYQSSVALFESGTLENETYEGYRAFVAAVIESPGGNRFWLEWKAIYNAKMVNALQARISEGGLPDVLTFPQFNFKWDELNESKST